MTKWQRSIPDGMRDTLFGGASAKREAREKLIRLMCSRGFNEIITPAIEFYDVFLSAPGALSQEDMYKLFDSKGRILALRPDMTTPIARVIATKLSDGYFPLRLFYCQNVYRQNESMGGKRDEITQFGAEIIGIGSVRSDTDIIFTASEALTALTDDFKLEIGHMGIYRAVAGDSLSKEQFEKIRLAIENKNLAALNDEVSSLKIGDDRKKALLSLPSLFGGKEVLKEAKRLLPFKEAAEIIDYLESILERLAPLGVSDKIVFDLAMVQRINYYTGLIFKGFMAGVGEPCLSGGRYDDLTAFFGRRLRAIGFAINLDLVLDFIKKEKDSPSNKALIHFEKDKSGEAAALLRKLVKDGFVCELSLFDELSESETYAQKTGAELFIIT